MTRTFTTPRFQTAFDRVVEPLALPGRLSSGAAPQLTTVDQVVRGTAVIGRFIASAGLLGVKVRPTGRPVRVTTHFRYDSMALEWWEDRIATPGPVRGAGAPRLLLVRSQGRTRGAALLIRPAADFRRAATGVVSFDLQQEELTAEGLFVLEMVSADMDRPEWAPAVAAGSVGIMMEAIEFAEVHGDREVGLVSTGTLPVDPDSITLTLPAGYFVANPTGRDEPRRWIAAATLVEPLVPRPRIKVAPVVEPVEIRPSTSQGIRRKVKRRIKRAARWVVPVAAVPVARRVSRRTMALERKVLRAARRRMHSAPPVTVAPPTPAPPVGPPPNPLADAMADLVSRNLVRVELAGIEPGATPGVQVRARAGAEIEIVTDGPVMAPALIRLSIDPSVLRELPGVDDKTVRWELVVQSEP